ncbi:MAG: tRNA (N6-isopentenyl adenosine(37)-C2)-methylthiotransferase MiaB [Clostridia bacterium]|nr:tRNA (N6-isopentenyl adenosine(37)-C2)-methylthiotransferase MiaB [Clostridia bacterium]
MSELKKISSAEIDRQREYIDRIRTLLNQRQVLSGKPFLAYTKTFGCQQNENDTERINGMLSEMGFVFTDLPAEADVILFNTCAVRDHAEKRVLGTVGSLVSVKRNNPNAIVALCGCMMQQPAVAEEIKKKYRHVDLLFGPHALYRFPENLYRLLNGEERRIFDNAPSDGNIAEGLPILRADKTRAWVSVMSGCNNFCTYCIVPYVRGRERSREPESVLKEVSGLIGQGYKEITLLGQNVNSYCNDLDREYDFSDLLREIDAIEGDFTIRFMTSHPKDASPKLIETIANSTHISRHIHLPFQSGSDRILKMMNRKYTREDYLSLIALAKEKIPGVAFTSDVIVGFPTETEDDFEETLSLIKEVEFDGLYTFLYSPRNGTPAATMEGQIPESVKKERYQRLLELQSELSAKANEKFVGQVISVLVTGQNEKDPALCDGRTDSNKVVHFPGNYPQGTRVSVLIDRAQNWGMYGTVCTNEIQ